jgi:ribonuclease Z
MNLYAQRDFSNSEITKVVLLGTGTPIPDPDRSGCSVAIIVNSMPYIIDFGSGLIRRLAARTDRYGKPENVIEGLRISNIKRAFLTHLHSDHTMGYPELIFTPWSMDKHGKQREEPLQVYGPVGITKMTENILEAFEEDIKYRIHGSEPINNLGWQVNSLEITEEGVVYEDINVKVEAFPVPHGSWPNAWGYRFTTPDKVIVISGDTSPSEKLIKYATGADILIHEVISNKKLKILNNLWGDYLSKNHTTDIELGQLANQAKPKLLVAYHILSLGATEKSMLNEINKNFKGKIVIGRDLDMF